jgi:hypothetical protein
MNFTQNNHLRYTIGGRLYSERQNSVEPYILSVGQVDSENYKHSSYQNELLRTAELVYNDLGKEFALFLSGGTDSEIVARNFLDIGVTPVCYTIKFKDEYNASDVAEAVDLAAELKVPLHVIDFDVKDFLRSGEAAEFGNKIQCTQITYLMVYHCILKLGIPSVMGGEVLLKRNIATSPSSWYYCIRENEDASAMRFSLTYNIPLVNEWFSYTPELLLYYLTDPGIVDLVTAPLNYKLSSVTSKNTILRRLCPYVRDRRKTHGFEKLLGFNFEAYRQLTSSQLLRLEPSIDGIEYSAVVKQLKNQI